MHRPLATIHIRSRSPASQDGLLIAGHLRVPCKLGRTGRRVLKREGDGATPSGLWPMRRLLLRRDACRPPRSALPVRFIAPDDGWCDDPADRNYNRPVRLPYPASHEELWRKDHLYDVVVVLGHNERPRRKGGGSAVFFHLADPDGKPTAGCIAISLADMRKVLAFCGPRTRIRVW